MIPWGRCLLLLDSVKVNASGTHQRHQIYPLMRQSGIHLDICFAGTLQEHPRTITIHWGAIYYRTGYFSLESHLFQGAFNPPMRQSLPKKPLIMLCEEFLILLHIVRRTQAHFIISVTLAIILFVHDTDPFIFYEVNLHLLLWSLRQILIYSSRWMLISFDPQGRCSFLMSCEADTCPSLREPCRASVFSQGSWPYIH